MRVHVSFNLYLPEGMATFEELEEWIRYQLGGDELGASNPLLGRTLLNGDFNLTEVEVEER